MALLAAVFFLKSPVSDMGGEGGRGSFLGILTLPFGVFTPLTRAPRKGRAEPVRGFLVGIVGPWMAAISSMILFMFGAALVACNLFSLLLVRISRNEQ